MNGTPMVRVELEHARHQIATAFAARQDEIKSIVDAELAQLLQPESIAAMVRDRLEKELAKAVERGVEDALRYTISYELQQHLSSVVSGTARRAIDRLRDALPEGLPKRRRGR